MYLYTMYIYSYIYDVLLDIVSYEIEFSLVCDSIQPTSLQYDLAQYSICFKIIHPYASDENKCDFSLYN